MKYGMNLNLCSGLPRNGVLRRLDRCASPTGALGFQPSAFSLQQCRFAALTPAEIKIVEGTAK